MCLQIVEFVLLMSLIRYVARVLSCYLPSKSGTNIATLDKLGNIVVETLCFLLMFPCLSTLKNIVIESILFSEEAKIFEQSFTIRAGYHFLQKCFLVCPHRETGQIIDGKQCFIFLDE